MVHVWYERSDCDRAAGWFFRWTIFTISHLSVFSSILLFGIVGNSSLLSNENLVVAIFIRSPLWSYEGRFDRRSINIYVRANRKLNKLFDDSDLRFRKRKHCDIELFVYLNIVTRWRELFWRIEHRCGLNDTSNLAGIDDLTGPICMRCIWEDGIRSESINYFLGKLIYTCT